MANITLGGQPFHTNAELPAMGSQAPDFSLVDAQLGRVGLAAFNGHKKLISVVPSLDTPVCALSTKRMNEEAKLRPQVHFLVVSADLPFAAQRFCTAEAADNVKTLSLMCDTAFARDYGVLIEDGPLAGLCARAVLVLGEDDRVLYAQLVGEIKDEPDYDAAMHVLDLPA